MNPGSLVEKLYEVFPNTKPPESESLINHICDECLALRHDFDGKRWQEISNEIIESHTNDLPLFTAEAFHYYIPAYFRHVLEVEDQYATTAEFLLYCLYNTADQNQKQKHIHNERMKRFSQEQSYFIFFFLNHLQSNSEYNRLSEDIAMSLAEFEKQNEKNV